MIPKEVLKKIRRIEITTSRMVTDVFAGAYHSVFKGQGIEFEEVREYQIGDDIRSIDWNVTARTGKPHVKKFVEERELSVMVIVDVSSSSKFGTRKNLKSTVAAEIAAVLASSAIKNNDRVGLIIFSDIIEKFIPPRKGLKHVLRIIREILYFEPKGKGTDIDMALDYLNKVTTRKTVAFLISDFICFNDKANELSYSFKKSMSIANRRHDLIAVTLNDPQEFDLNRGTLVCFEDAETGEDFFIDTSNKKVLEIFKKNALDRKTRLDDLFGSIGVDNIDIFTDKPYENSLVKFFKSRKKRLSR